MPLNAKGERIYSTFDFVHRLFSERIISRMLTEKAIKKTRAKTISDILGAFNYNVPPSVHEGRLKALEKLRKDLGDEKAIETIQHLTILLNEQETEFNNSSREINKEIEERYPKGHKMTDEDYRRHLLYLVKSLCTNTVSQYMQSTLYNASFGLEKLKEGFQAQKRVAKEDTYAE